MAYDEQLAKRISAVLKPQKGIIEKKMFGGIAFMLKDKMFCGIIKNDLMVRVLEDKFDALLKKPNAREMDFAGRPMRGFLYISPDGIKTDKQLKNWIDMGLEYVSKSPPKKKKPKKNKPVKQIIYLQ
jgi:TfoX/Sxy family transcriptional regulator of competence genes